MSDPTDPDRLREHALAGRSAAENSALARAKYRRRYKPTSKRRQEALLTRLRVIDEAMKRIRSDIGLLQWHYVPEDVADELRDASAACQIERRKLKKMLGRDVLLEDPS